MHLKHRFAIQEVAGTFIAVAADDHAEPFHGLIRMNETGKDIFELLAGDVTEAEVVFALQKKYEEPEKKIREEVHKFVMYLAGKNILQD